MRARKLIFVGYRLFLLLKLLRANLYYNVFTLTISEYREIAPFLYEVKSCPIRLILETIFRISLNAYLNAFHEI